MHTIMNMHTENSHMFYGTLQLGVYHVKWARHTTVHSWGETVTVLDRNVQLRNIPTPLLRTANTLICFPLTVSIMSQLFVPFFSWFSYKTRRGKKKRNVTIFWNSTSFQLYFIFSAADCLCFLWDWFAIILFSLQEPPKVLRLLFSLE